ncbi:MAG: prepilin-type N-terminal cleavage/methylation domain-containing protein [Candidatus Methylacidiphilales bacterium]|nr:prepilin-type N-terminal cleavage/methylation domain-containing protein [Candidatus Methylacidiphilales bacterium]
MQSVTLIYMTHDSLRKARRRGFTMIELLTVITLVTVVTALSVKGLSGGNSGASAMRQCLTETTSLITQARMLAMSQNTYVYIFFRRVTAKRRVEAMVVYSKTGLNVYSNAAGALHSVSADLAPAHTRVVLDGVRLLDRSTVPVEGTGGISRPQPAFIMDLGSDYKLTHQGDTYDRSLVFRPTGEVYIPPLAYTGVVEIALEPVNGAGTENVTTAGPQAAVVQIVGATGQAQVYRVAK